MDIANLGIRVDSSQVVGAKQALQDLKPAAAQAESAVDELGDAAQATGNQLDGMEKKTNKLGIAFEGIKGLAAGAIAAFGIEGVRRAADSYTEFTNRLRVAGLEGQAFVDVENRLFEAANRSGAQISAMGELYSRLSLASESLGAKQEELLSFVDGVSASLKVAGGSASSASGALIQLSQALGGGVVRAEEFNSILEGAPTIARAAALGIDEAGGSISRLRELVLSGTLTSKQFFEGFLEGSESMKATAEGMAMTMGAALTALWNGITRVVGTFDQLSGASGFVANSIYAIAEAMNYVAQNAGNVVSALAPLAPLFLATFGPVILGAVVSLAGAIGVQLFTAVKGLFLLLHANPFYAVASIILTIMSYMVNWQTVIADLTRVWGAFVYAWGSFWGDESAKTRGIEIVLNANEAAKQITDAGKNVGNLTMQGFTTGGNNAGSNIEGAMNRGGTNAAAKIGNAFVMTAERATAIYERMNGKMVETIGTTIIQGTELAYNRATGEITKAGKEAGEEMETGVVAGGQTAANAMSTSLAQGGATLGDSIYGNLVAGANVWSNAANKFVGDIIYRTIQLQQRLMLSEIAKNYADANATSLGGSNNSYGGGGAGGSGSMRSGGGGSGKSGSLLTKFPLLRDYAKDNFIVGVNRTGVNGLKDTQGRNVYGADGISGRTFTVSGGAIGTGEGNRSNGLLSESYGLNGQPIQLNVVNVTDPSAVPAAMNTQSGAQTFLNLLRNNREEVAAILGVS